jgi:ClpP class serine protease
MHNRVLSAMLGGMWLMDEDRVRLMLDIIQRPRSADEIQAIEAQLGRPLDNTRAVTMRGSTAVIPITGPIFRYANLFTALSGATSTESLALDITQALDNPGVQSILLNVDSPGGEATGINELAQMMHDARGRKPMWAYVEGMGASAAYWLSSAADRIVMDATAAVGSIGVVMAVPDKSTSKQTMIEFVSSQSPNKRPDPSTERGRAQLQTLVDDMATVFVDAVARNRGVDADTVLSAFGAGGMKVGRAAVETGMADALGSFEATLAELAAKTKPAYYGTRGAFDAREHFKRAIAQEHTT